MLPKIVNFLWLTLHNSVPVRDVLASRGIDCDRRCPLCKSHSELVNHLLRECVFARDFQHKIRALAVLIGSFNSDLLDWLKVNCTSKVNHHSQIPWSYIFPFALWCLGKHRNRVVFDNVALNPNLQKQCLNQALEYFYCMGKMKMQQSKVVANVGGTSHLLDGSS